MTSREPGGSDDEELPRSLGESGRAGGEQGPVSEAEAQARQLSTAEEPLGRPGRQRSDRSPFVLGMTAAAGVAVTYGVVQLILTARQVLILIGLAFFVAMGLEPAVSWLVRRRLPRWAAVLVVLVVFAGAVAGLLAAAIPALVSQAGQFAGEIPGYLHKLQDPHSALGQLNIRFGLEQRVQRLLSGSDPSLVNGVLGAGELLLGVVSGSVVIAVLVVYFLAAMPRIRQWIYRLFPATKRPRAVLIGDEVFIKIGAYLLGNVIISGIAGLAAFVWMLIFHVPYPLLLAAVVAVLDLIPVVGSISAGVIVTVVSATVSVPVALATAGFFVVYRFVEDYLLVPRIIGRTVRVPAVVTVLAVLLGGALLGVIGALVAIPIAAVLLLLLRQIVVPRLDSR